MISEIWSEMLTTAMSSRRKTSLPYVKKHELKECFVKLEKLTDDKLLVQAEKYTTDTCPLRSEKSTFDTYKEKYNLKKCFVRVAKIKFNPHKDDTYFSNLRKSVDSVNNEKVPGSMRENSKNCAGSVKKFKCTEGVIVPSELFAGLLSEKCNVCLSAFQSKRGLWLHLQQEHKEEVPFMCRLCLRVFFNSDSLISHGLQPCKCGMCGKTISKLTFEFHLKSCRVYNPYRCKICMESFFNSDAFHDHMKQHTESNFLFCHMHKHFEKGHAVSTGITELQPINTAVVSFNLLPVSSSKDSAKSNKENLRDFNHINSNADKYLGSQNGSIGSSLEEKGRCSVCLCTFKDLRSLWLHVQDHAEETPFRCISCLQVFSNSDSLISHRIQPCKCAMCGMIVATLKFENHLNFCEVYNTYYCRICEKRFSSDTFYSHMNSHKNSKTLLSTNCGEFQSSSQISKNKEMHHPDSTSISELEWLCEKESKNIEYVKDRISEGETEVFTHNRITKSSYCKDTFAEGEGDNPINFVVVVLKEEQDLQYNEGDIVDPLH